MSQLISEIKKFFSAPKNLIFMVLGPIFFTFFFGMVYNDDYLNNIPIAVMDMDKSSLSRNILDEFDNDSRYIIEYYAEDISQIHEMVETGQVSMGLIIPEGFTKDIKAKKSSKAVLVLDGTNMAIANNALSSANEIIATVSTGIDIEFIKSKNTPSPIAKNYASMFNINNKNMWDSKLSYKNYMLPGMVLVLAQQLFLSVFVINYISDRRNIFYKALIHVTTGAFSYYLCLLVLKKILHITLLGNIVIASGFAGLYLISLTGSAMTIGALTKKPVRATQFCMIMSLPSFLTAGYVWPIFKMPIITKALIKIFWPLIYIISPLKDYLIKGVFPSGFWINILQLTLFGFIWIFIGLKLSHRLLPEISNSSET